MAKLKVIKLSKGKKKKKNKSRYTAKGSKRNERIRDGLALASQRVLTGVEDGLHTYRAGRTKSSKKGRDGASKDRGIIVAKSAARAIRMISWAPGDVRRGVSPKRNPTREFIGRLVLPIFK